MRNPCVYLGEWKGIRHVDETKIRICQINGKCVCGQGDSSIAGCETCKQKLTIQDAGFPSKWIDPLEITNRQKEPFSALRDMLAGSSAFLACGGPSANDLPLEQLNGRGMWTITVNNMGGHQKFRPQAMVCSDPPKKFSHSIWLDPGIMKFVPIPKFSGSRAKLRIKVGGKFKVLDERVVDCPNVWGFKRESWLKADNSFFLGDGACWGNLNSGVKKTGEKKTVCSTLLAMRIMRYLGCKRLYLIGVDFRMAPDYGYSFGQGRTQGASNSNNNQFSVVNDWLCRMQEGGVFKRFGMEIFNCFELSSCRAFPYVPFEDAVKDVRGRVEQKPDLKNWYEKK